MRPRAGPTHDALPLTARDRWERVLLMFLGVTYVSPPPAHHTALLRLAGLVGVVSMVVLVDYYFERRDRARAAQA